MKSALRWLQRIGQSIPVIMILAIVIWSYYAFVVSLGSILPNPEIKTFYLISYHAVFVIFLLSYIRIIFSNPGTVPPQFYLTAVEKEGLDSSADPRKFLEDVGSRLPVHETTLTNNVRYCEVCVCIKPDRAHHCSICRRCILKMDHHCPWVNNCVGFRNYKYFTTFLMYSCVYCLVTALFVAPWSLYIWTRVPELQNLPELTRFNIMILFFVAGMFFLSVLGLWVFHCYLTASNRSTLEMGRSPRFRDEVESGRSGYDIGCRNNCTEVYGSGAFILCPVYTSRGNGVLYPRDRTERGSSDMRRLLGSHGDDSEDEDVVVYNGDIPLNLQPVP